MQNRPRSGSCTWYAVLVCCRDRTPALHSTSKFLPGSTEPDQLRVIIMQAAGLDPANDLLRCPQHVPHNQNNPVVLKNSAEQAVPAPTLAHSSHLTLQHGQSKAAADHPVPEPKDRGFAQEAQNEVFNSVPISRLDSLTLDCQSAFLSTRYFASRGSGNVSRPKPPGAIPIGCQCPLLASRRVIPSAVTR